MSLRILARVPCATRLSRPQIAPLFHTASISYEANPNISREAPINASSKIPPASRPLARPSISPPTATPEQLAAMPYMIRRTAFAQLPIYRKWKAGGTKEVIHVKKVTGDKRQLVQELVKELEIPEEKITISQTGSLLLYGKWLDKTFDFFVKRGF